MRSVNNETTRFMNIVIKINIKVNETLVSYIIFVIKNNQIFERLILETLFIITERVNFKSLNNDLIITYTYDA